MDWRYIALPLWGVLQILAVLAGTSLAARGEDLACLSTTFRILGANDKICISVFDDPKVPGVACHVAQARTGGIKGSLGLAEDPRVFRSPAGRLDRLRLISQSCLQKSLSTRSAPLSFSNIRTCLGS